MSPLDPCTFDPCAVGVTSPWYTFSQVIQLPGGGSSRVALTPGAYFVSSTHPKLSQKCTVTARRRQSYSVVVCDGAEEGKYAQLAARVLAYFTTKASSCSCALCWYNLSIHMEKCLPWTSLKIFFSFRLHRPKAKEVWTKPRMAIRQEPHLVENLFEIIPWHYHLKCFFLKQFFLFFFVVLP